jgi:hypothetical protein
MISPLFFAQLAPPATKGQPTCVTRSPRGLGDSLMVAATKGCAAVAAITILGGTPAQAGGPLIADDPKFCVSTGQAPGKLNPVEEPTDHMMMRTIAAAFAW